MDTPTLYATAWAALPPIIAIVLALITKEVYSSLFVGIVTGAVLYAGTDFMGVLNHVVDDGIVASLSDSYNVGILVFLVVLGILVTLVNMSGSSKAFGDWALTKVRSRVASQLAAMILGVLIFVDDYFNCLTVGSVMKPVTDNYRVSRAKLAYIIDSTAAPVCIIAPISSWAAAVTGLVEGQNGFKVFIEAIPYNFYAIFTLVAVVAIIVMKFDYGKMVEYERNAVEKGDLFTVKSSQSEVEDSPVSKGKLIDMLLPIIVLVASCLFGMLYSGGILEGASFRDAFANCDAASGLSKGSLVALVFTIIYYICRRILSFGQCCNTIPEGLKLMISPMLILTFAWSLKAMTDSLGLEDFVKNVVSKMGSGVAMFIPAVLFLIACLLAFASGTSWGTFGMLIPIGLAITEAEPELTIPVVAACMAGAVYGDHCSPISDTTIMASAGAGCDHISHVTSQLPYASLVAIISCISYLITGFTKGPWIALIFGTALLILALLIIKITKWAYVIPEKTED